MWWRGNWWWWRCELYYQTHWLLRAGIGSSTIVDADRGTAATTCVTSFDDESRLLFVVLWCWRLLLLLRLESLTICDPALPTASCDVVVVNVLVVPVELLLFAKRWKWPPPLPARNWFGCCRVVWWRLGWLLRWWVRITAVAVPPLDVVRFCNDGWSTELEPSGAQQFHSGHNPIEWTANSSFTANHSSAGIFLVSTTGRGGGRQKNKKQKKIETQEEDERDREERERENDSREKKEKVKIKSFQKIYQLICFFLFFFQLK